MSDITPQPYAAEESEKIKEKYANIKDFISSGNSDSKALPRILSDMKSFVSGSASYYRDVQKSIELAKKRRRIVRPALAYDDNAHNLICREYIFVQTALHELTIESYEELLKSHENRLQQANSIVNLLSDTKIKGISILLPENFLKPKPDQQLSARLEILRAYKTRLELQISKFPHPQWESNLPSFLSALAAQSSSLSPPGLSYSPPCPLEISLSRYLFVHHDMDGKAIDRYIAYSASSKFESFMLKSIQFCQSILKHFQLSKAESNALVGIFFRAMMDRVYEAHHEMIDNGECSFDVSPIDSIKLEDEVMSKEFASLIKSGNSMRRSFIESGAFMEASRALQCSAFIVNPLDSLYYVFQSEGIIDDVGHKLSKDKNINHLLEAGDLTTIRIGVFLASDIPDLVHLDKTIKWFTDTGCLDPNFSLMKNHIEAVSQYIQLELGLDGSACMQNVK